MKLIAWVAAVLVTGVGSTLPWDGAPGDVGRELAPDAELASAFLSSVAGSNPVVCTLTIRGILNRWGRFGSMVIGAEGGMATESDQELLQWIHRSNFEDDVVDPLVRGLAHSDPCQRRTAAALFDRVDMQVARRALEALTNTGSRDSRIAAVRALGYVESPGSVATLSAALQDNDAEMRQVAAWALGEVENSDAIPVLSKTLEEDQDVGVRINAAWALGQIENSSAVPVLTRSLASDQDPRVRRAAAWALGQMS